LLASFGLRMTYSLGHNSGQVPAIRSRAEKRRVCNDLGVNSRMSARQRLLWVADVSSRSCASYTRVRGDSRRPKV
jgi:hypothetical protein